MSPRQERWLRGGLAASFLLFALLQFILIFRDDINSDEFGLLQRAVDTIQTGTLVSGGRTGLGTITLMPIVHGCHDVIATMWVARGLWWVFTMSFLVGVFAIVRELCRGEARPWAGGALAVALLAMMPPFLRWSVQVRTDQPSIACAVWGGYLLLVSARRPRLAIFAGVAFGFGYLFTQKVAYLVCLGLGLSGLEWLLSARERGRWELAGAVRRLAMAGLAAGIVVALYHLIVWKVFGTAPASISRAIDAMDFYRSWGFRVYRSWFPLLVAHALCALAFVLATLAELRSPSPGRSRLVLAWAAMAMGAAVVLYHGTRLPYFWMTLGVFPAIGFGVALPTMMRRLGRTGPLFLCVVGVLLLQHTIPEAALLLRDPQNVQRRSFAFVERNFRPEERGFQPEHGLYCRNDPAHFPWFLYPGIKKAFGGSDGDHNKREFIAEFARRPVSFIIGSFRLKLFPKEIQAFWNKSYVPYSASVQVPGRSVAGKRGASLPFNIVRRGRYRYYAPDPGMQVSVGEHELAPGDVIDLDVGEQTLTLRSDVRDGMIAIDLPEPPAKERSPFYSREVELETGGFRTW